MELLVYFGKVNLYWILFYACYWLLFRNHTFFVWNRFYLLGSLLISFALPLIHFPDHARVIPTAVYAVSVVPVYVTRPESVSVVLHWTSFALVIQFIGATLMLFKFMEGFTELFKLMGQGETIPLDNHMLVLLPHNEIGSFSFFKWLVVNSTDYEQNFDPILRHESVHIRQLHSLDILLIEILKVVFWFNPVLWFYKRSLQEVHEYLADEEAPNRDHYAKFLVAYALNAPVASLTNHFFNSSLLKSRITMIYKNRNSNWVLSKYMLVFPLTAARERLLDAVERKDYKIISNKEDVVKGTVRDENGRPIKAATVIVKATNKGTATDENGRFTLDDVAIGSRLVITHINFEPFEIEVNGTSAPDGIVLRKKENVLSEVTVKQEAKSDPGKKGDLNQSKEFTVVEQQPQFPGGMDELGKFLSSAIVYPSEAAKDHVEGKVLVSFIVNENGYIREPRILKGIGHGLDEEALRVVLKMPRWEPGLQGGEPVAVQYNLPVNFQLASDKEKSQSLFNNFSEPANQFPLSSAKDVKIGQNIATPGQSRTIKGQYLATSVGFPDQADRRFKTYNVADIPAGQGDFASTAGTRITVKGAETIPPIENPLVVLDGKIMENLSIDNIKPESIESINVLKGATATSVYGVKGINGAIIIKSRKK
jgi:TonB family protein